MRFTLFALAFAVLAAGQADADDQQGYYYPPITSSEEFKRQLVEAPPANRAVRIGFVTQVTRQQMERPMPPRYAMLAKGSEAEELILVALDDEVFRTLFRARGVLAQLSAPARTTEFFLQNDLAPYATFFDMVRVMGFRNITISDGVNWSHRVEFN